MTKMNSVPTATDEELIRTVTSLHKKINNTLDYDYTHKRLYGTIKIELNKRGYDVTETSRVEVKKRE